MISLPFRPSELEQWRGRHLQLAELASTKPITDMHLMLAAFYREQIAAIIMG